MMKFISLGAVERARYTLNIRSRAVFSKLTQKYKTKYKNRDNIILLCVLNDTG